MSKALMSLVCFLGAFGVAVAEGPQLYHAEVVIHQGPEKPGGASIISRPVMRLAEGHTERALVGQSVRLWGEGPVDGGVRAEGLVRASEGGLTLRMVIEHSELVRDSEGDPQISTARTELEKVSRLDAPIVVKPVNVGEKTLWAEIRLQAAPK